MALRPELHVSPTPTSEIRSQAIAKLKRAASLPRTPDGRRPEQPGSGGPSTNPSASTSEEGHARSGGANTSAATPSPSRIMNDYGDEELLSAPVFSASTGMQRSTSESSSYHIPTPQVYSSATASPFFSAQPSPVGGPGTDWAAYQLAQSYLPSISPVSVPPSSFPANLQASTGPFGQGRNTPSPLPSLGDLRSLSRSNSAMARAKAMMALTGQVEAPTRSTNIPTPTSSDEDITLGIPGSRLTRAGTIGIPRMFGVSSADTSANDEAAVESTPSVVPVVAPMADVVQDVPRPGPRLQRSFTVSSSNMGEERRSAVGRRMVERLAERRAARQKEEVEVRHLWEERRRTRQLELDAAKEAGLLPEAEASAVPLPDLSNISLHIPSANGSTSTSSPSSGIAPLLGPQAAGGISDRTPSRNTERSDEFEYESHLHRSLSSRTAREVLETNTMPSPFIENAAEHGHGSVFQHQQQQPFTEKALPPHPQQYDDEDDEDGEEYDDDQQQHERDHHLLLPVQPFASTSRHAPHDSTSSAATVMPPVGHSPGSDSTATLDSGGLFYNRHGSGNGVEPPIDENGDGWDDDHNVDWVTGHRSKDTHHNNVPDAYRQQHEDLSVMSHTGHDTDFESVDHGRGQHPGDRSSSRMSWEEVGDEPVDPFYRKNSGSISRKTGRGVFQAIRKYSRSSVTSQVTSPPASPHAGFNANNQHGVVRRESESASSTGQRSGPRESPTAPVRVNHQASNSSITPSSTTTDTVASANNLLIQHQLSAPSPVGGFLPRAEMSDPRIHNSKLSPFPGITTLEQKQRSRSGSDTPDRQPRLVQQNSDPNVATVRNGISATPVPQERESADAANHSTRRHWFGKGSHHSRGSGSGSGIISVPSSQHSYSTSDDYRNGRRMPGESPTEELDAMSTARSRMSPENPKKPRPEIPQYMYNRRRAPPPPIELGSSNVESINGDVPQQHQQQLQQLGNMVPGLTPKSAQILNHMDDVLGLSSNDPTRSDFLDDPPRKLLLSQQVLQVVNVHTVKDRFLFLFNDILVIAKPVITHGSQANLDMKFIVKSVVPLDKLTVSGLSEEPTVEPPQHPAVTQFIQQFSEDSAGAVRQLVERSAFKIDSVTLANLLFMTPKLDKSQIGHLLATDSTLLSAFATAFHFENVRIEEALRMFILAVRLPSDIAAAETLLRGFARGYHNANKDRLLYAEELAEDLVLSTLELNDMLYSTFGFAFPNHAVSCETFVQAFYSKDVDGLVADEVLEEIYTSVRQCKLVQSLGSHEGYLAREITLTPAHIPSRLTFNEWSETIAVTIPAPDPAFKLKLLGEGLQFDPPILDFAHTREASFRVRGLDLGNKAVLFGRMGTNAALYAGIGNTRSFNVERACMRHTFHLQFISHVGQRRKYCFSVPDSAARARWGQMLTRQVWLTTEKKQGAGAPTTQAGHVRRAAEAVSLQVLRDALIPPEDRADEAGTPGSRKPSNEQRELQRTARVASVSLAYAAKANGEEAALGPLVPTKGHRPDFTAGTVKLQTGKELVLLCRQNSLLPGVLELLQGGTQQAPQAAGPPPPPPKNNNAPVAIPPAAHLQMGSGQQPQRSAGLKAMMHDRRL